MKIFNNKILSLSVALVFVLLASIKVQAQTPGGTGLGTELWLSADRMMPILPSDGADVYQWNDLSGKNRTFIQNGTNFVPRVSYSGYNFNPLLEFYLDDDASAANNRARKLVSATDFPVETTKGYYTFWVSTLDAEASTTTACVFTSNTGRNDINGWYTSDGVIRHETRGTAYNHSYVGNTYGIGTSYRPNVATAGVVQAQYYNGVASTTTMAARTMYTTSNGPAVIGNSSLTTTDYFYGDVSEIIVLSTTAGMLVDPLMVMKVNSYLAIKYGINLDGGEYVNSSGNSVWSSTGDYANYNKNVFGIARDDASELYQKQSSSVESKFITVFLGDEVADLNINNTATIANDKSYLMFGSNGLSEYEPYSYKENAVFQGGAVLGKEVNFRYKNVLKAKITGPAASFTVNMRAGALFVLVSANDPDFSPGNTRIYPVDEDGIAKDVVINDGDYVGLATYATAPGGVVNGLRLWLKADDLSSLVRDGNGDIDIWKDQTPNFNDFNYKDLDQSYAPLVRPNFVECSDKMNFHPSLYFTHYGFLGLKNGPMSVNDPTGFTSFIVYNSDATTTDGRLYTHSFGTTRPHGGAGRHPAFGFAPTKGTGRIYLEGRGAATGVDGPVFGFKQRSTALHMVQTKKYGTEGGPALYHDFGGWGWNINQGSANTNATGNSTALPRYFGENGGATSGYLMAKAALIGGGSLLYAPGNTSSGSFIGLMSEIFFYERALDKEEQDKIRSYLGVKYGITIDADQNSTDINWNYTFSDNSIFWAGNSLPNKGYHNNVVGLINDGNSGMFINKAKSSGYGATVTMKVPGHTECGQGDTPTLPNLSALFWGHNNVDGQIQLKGNPDVCGEMDYRMGRIWMVDKTNLDEQEVTISFSQSDYFQWGSSAYQLFFLVADSPESIDSNKWENAIPATYVDGEHQLKYKFTDKYTYFTIGVKELRGACESCEFGGVKKLSFTNATWPRGATENLFDLGDGFTANVKTTIESGASFYSRYPRASSQNSLREYRRGQSAPVMTTEVTLSKAAAATFQIHEIDREGRRYDEIEVYGMCGTAEVTPNLSYVTSSARSSYQIIGRTALAKRRPTSSYTSNAGKMYVEFDYPVEKIIIKQKSSGAATGSQRIGIGPMSFSCPQPLPPINEDGLSFQKEATPEVLLCEEVIFTYRINNTNCSDKIVNLTDTLPEGMTWSSYSLSVSDESALATEDDNSYAGKKELKLENVKVPPASTLTIRMKATFEMTATAGTYDTGKSTIAYERLVNDVPQGMTLQSCDRLTTGCESTKVIAIDVPDRPYPVELVSYTPVSGCYTENDVVTVTMKVSNPNTFTIGNAALDVGFNEEFTYVAGSLSSPTITGLSSPEVDDGYLYIEGFDLPTGEHTITFQIKAPVKTGLVLATDIDGNMLDEKGVITTDPNKQGYTWLDISFEMMVESDDVCIGSTVSNVNGNIEMSYCTSAPCIITNRMATKKLKK